MELLIQDKKLCVCGKFPRIVKLQDEYFEWIKEPHRFLADLKSTFTGADLFTFVERGVSEVAPKYDFYCESDDIAVLEFSSYQEWFKNQIRTQERNRIKKAEKSKVEVRLVEFDDDLVKGIKNVYDESPMRQGKQSVHYHKSFETLKRENGTFLDRCRFIGAYYQGELIGFVRLMFDDEVSYLIQIISMISHRDKAPTNALLAKAIEVCAGRGAHYLRYGNWCRRGLGDFKRNHGFQRVSVPRYFVPLNLRGELSLRLRLHRNLSHLMPEKVLDLALDLRDTCKCTLLTCKCKLLHLENPSDKKWH